MVTAGLVELGYVQQLGRGLRRTRLLLERNGNPPLEVEKDGFTRLILRARP
jgi:predicted HTH transcriptional regulator